MLPDYLQPNLRAVFVGLNPGEYSDRVGHYFARSQNLFWTALYRSGLVPEPLRPEDDARLPEYGFGLTDIVKRASRGVDEVSREEFAEGGRVLRDKLITYKPGAACFVGLVGYRQAFNPRATLGLQPERWDGTALYIVPSTSPRNAHYRPEIVDWFRRFKEYLDQEVGHD